MEIGAIQAKMVLDQIKAGDAVAIHNEAEAAGYKACGEAQPDPMIVDTGTTAYYVPDGVCGFASVHVRCKGRAAWFIRNLKKAGLASADTNDFDALWKPGTYGGYYYWVVAGNQSMERKRAFARAYVEVLKSHGIDAHYRTQID
jgi:hypothetical protein